MQPTIPLQSPQRSASRRSLRAGARGYLPPLDSPGFTSWPVMRRDLLTWLLLGDLAAIAAPTLLRALLSSTDVLATLMTLATGTATMLLAWALGSLRVDVVDQARSGWGRLLTAAAVSFIGTIGFVGLIAPHMARSLVGEDHRFALPLAAVTGAVILIGASVVGKILSPGGAIPVGIITAVAGVPMLFGIILRSGQRSAA